ncbi:hypothetical protein BEN74_16990 [Acinetobacter sp. WCHAc010034]|nr:hypothetical protein BEN74_16990 [Acinetobacter sp. WCHAc010034]
MRPIFKSGNFAQPAQRGSNAQRYIFKPVKFSSSQSKAVCSILSTPAPIAYTLHFALNQQF